MGRQEQSLGEGIRSHWALLGNRSSLSWQATLLFLPFGCIGPVFIDRARIGSSEVQGLLIALVGQLTVMACIAVASGAIHRVEPARSRPLLTAVAILIAMTARGLAIEWTSVAMGLSTTMEYSYRVGSSLPTMTGGYIVMALVVGAYERHRRLAASLAARRTELDLTHRSMQTQLHEVHRAVVAHVHQLVDPFLVAIDRLVKRIDHGSDAAPIADAMRKIADEQLRPLSQRLLNSASGVSPDDFKPVSGELPALPLPSHLHMHVLISPLAGLIVTMLSFSQAMRLAADPAILLLPIISGLVPILVFAGARAVIGGWAPRLWLGIAVAGGIGVLGLVLSVTVEEALGLPVPEYVMYAAPLTGLLLGLSTATYAAVSYRRSETERELQGYIDALSTASSLLTQHLFIERRNLSYVIHGSLQSALYAGSMRLLANPLPSQELVAAIRRDIALAAQKLDAHAVVAVRLEQTLTELSRMWSGECEIRWTMSERAELLLAAAPVTEASVGEIAREFITNAIRHGKATTVMVRIVVEQGCVQVTCDDDGRGVSASASRGVGSRMLDELCIRWDRTRDGLHTSVTADVAIAH